MTEKAPKTSKPATKAAVAKPAAAEAAAPAAPTVTVVSSEKTNTLSIVALVAGIVGLTFIPFLASIVAVVTGHMARAEVRRTGEQGGGLALAGLIMGYVGIGLAVLVISLLFAFLGVVIASGMGNYYY
ncbi:DUF4190 domain-containing protein [Aurantimicrobium minutum]|uniref:DUF4190 domain-containing protein n=1 Tax=Aurantimicrobium minutum TaxID=708131 RepID=A0A173LXU1_9MICO|nr:DUF4190 domain-containing protein [Aurantimicrobium minutum]BAU99720.1 Uncharacterized protein AUMI_111780 [Aurantimicrobium minutum]